MLRSIYITGALLLALSPALTGMSAPIQSADDVKRICDFSPVLPSKSEDFKSRSADANSLDSYVRFASAEAPSNKDDSARSYPSSAQTIASLVRARDYTVNRGGVLMRTYTVRFDADDFEFLRDEKDSDLLILHFPPTVPLFDDEAIAAWSAPTSLSFRVGEERAQDMMRLHSENELYLEAHVQLSAREAPNRPICQPNQEHPAVEFLLLEGTLRNTDDRRPLYHAVTERYERAACEHRSATSVPDDAIPRVQVTSVSSIGEQSLSETEGVVLQLVTEIDVHACYMHALRGNSAMRGALVIEFALDEHGQIIDSGVVIDATNDRSLTRCTIDTIGNLEIPRDENASPLTVRLNLTFSR